MGMMDVEADQLASVPVCDIAGVSQKKAELLSKLKISTLGDLLLHRPRRYEDRSHCCTIEQAEDGKPSVFKGSIQSIKTKRFRQRRGSLVEVVISDGTGELTCRWWNQPYAARSFSEGQEILAFGKPALAKSRTMDQPEIEILEGDESEDIHVKRIVPIYPLTQGVTQRWLRQLLWKVCHEYASLVPNTSVDFPVAVALVPRSEMTREAALLALHFPEEIADTKAAILYFAEEELIAFQIKLQLRRLRFNQKAKAPQCNNANTLVHPLLSQLPFRLTKAQERVMKEIRIDLNKPSPMRRLLQGDVGSGKTIISALTALMILESGHDVALMAPTELLAEQHYKNFSIWLKPLDIDLAYCTANQKINEISAPPTLTIGTHALLEKGYQPKQLGLVIIDEQHRFGVTQRDRLLRKGSYPHLLTMTATPIPRSLGLTVYGDLEHSILDERPQGRGKVRTYVRGFDRMERIWQFIETEVGKGHQAFVVYPRITAETEAQVKSIDSEFHRIKQRFPAFKVDCLHGQIDAIETATTMEAFRKNQIQILVATSVIEVGVDVPNATIMLIENAERFGLAQLHQMRGRIGRGKADSHCILVTHEEKEEAWERLRILESNSDGFAIAENDLKHRGPGEFLGQQQSGLPRFRFADLNTHRKLVNEIRSIVRIHLGIDAPSEAPELDLEISADSETSPSSTAV